MSIAWLLFFHFKHAIQYVREIYDNLKTICYGNFIHFQQNAWIYLNKTLIIVLQIFIYAFFLLYRFRFWIK